MTIGQFAGLTFGLAGGAIFLEILLGIIGFFVIGEAKRTKGFVVGVGVIFFGWFISGLMWLGAIITTVAWIVNACTGGFS